MSVAANEDGATLAKALEELGREPPSATDPYADPVARFGQLPPHVRAFLQRLSTRDVGTLASLIVNTQRAATTLRVVKSAVIWGAGAFAGAVAFGDQAEKFLSKVGGLLW